MPSPVQFVEVPVEIRSLSSAELRTILEDHQTWLATDGKEGKKAELFCMGGPPLKEIRFDLCGQSLSSADLSQAYLTFVNFSKCDLNFARFTKSFMLRTTCRELQHAQTFSGAVLDGADLSGMNGAMAILTNASIRDANLIRVILLKANLVVANFEGANLSGALLCEANLSDTRFTNASFDGATLTSAVRKRGLS